MGKMDTFVLLCNAIEQSGQGDLSVGSSLAVTDRREFQYAEYSFLRAECQYL